LFVLVFIWFGVAQFTPYWVPYRHKNQFSFSEFLAIWVTGNLADGRLAMGWSDRVGGPESATTKNVVFR
jgi:hypothetical protein